MRSFDLSPLFRASVGFDRLGEIMDWVNRTEEGAGTTYPPYNIEKTGEDAYRVSIAVAGFKPEELDINVHRSVLTVSGRTKSESDPGKSFLHRGIAGRAFERRFELADYVKVSKADLENGLLHIELVREVPEEAKPRKVAIGNTPSAKLINTEAKAA